MLYILVPADYELWIMVHGDDYGTIKHETTSFLQMHRSISKILKYFVLGTFFIRYIKCFFFTYYGSTWMSSKINTTQS